ncbi:hypothetical protein I3760_06G059400 [Carya illinoinensis]|nr:hypothetical protein I3760_06G059400 [Carya illinoinensis]
MTVLSWNVHGLRNPRGIRTLCNLVLREAPKIPFLQETLLKAREFEVYKFMLGFANCLVVECVGRKGGWPLMWGREISLSILSYSKCHNDALIDDDSMRGAWYLTGIYGYPKQNGESWMVLGDFNEILHHHEKWGGKLRPDRQVTAFRDVISDCSLRDMVYGENKYTWINRRGESQYHAPIWVTTKSEGSQIRPKRQFKFEEIWMGEKVCEDIIRATLYRSMPNSNMGEIMGLIKECGTELQRWNKNCFGMSNSSFIRLNKIWSY